MKIKLSDGTIMDVTGYSPLQIQMILSEDKGAQVVEGDNAEAKEEAEPVIEPPVKKDFTPGSATGVDSLPVEKPTPIGTVLDLEDTSSELPKTDPVDPPKVKTNISKLSLDSAITQYENAYGGSDGFEFKKDKKGVFITAPNGNEQFFKTSQRVGDPRMQKSTQDWSVAQEFIDNNKDPETWKAKKKSASKLEDGIIRIIERGDYFDLDGGDVSIKNSQDLLQNHPDLVQEIKKLAISNYDSNYEEEGQPGAISRLLGSGTEGDNFFSQSAFDVSGISDYRLDKIVDSAFNKVIIKESQEGEEEILNLIDRKAKKEFGGDENQVVNWAKRSGIAEISNPAEKRLAMAWSNVNNIKKELDKPNITPETQIELEKLLANSYEEATELTKEQAGDDAVFMFNPFEKNVSAQGSETEGGINVTERVISHQDRLRALKSGNYDAFAKRYAAHRIEMMEMRKNLKQPLDVKQTNGDKVVGVNTLGDLVDANFGTGIPDQWKAYSPKSDDSGTGSTQGVYGSREIEGVADEYLDLLARDKAFKNMYLLNIDPKSMERTGFGGAAWEGFLESLSNGDTVDYYSGLNDSDVLAVQEEIGNEAGIEWDEDQKKNFKETTSEFIGTTAGGLPVLAAEFAVANVVAGGALAITGGTKLVQGLRAGKYFKGASKAAMKHSDILKAAAADGYKGGILSKPVQSWIAKQPDIVKVGAGALDKLKALTFDSMVEGVKMQGVMGDGGFAMGTTFTPAAALTNTLLGRLGIRVKAKGPFHKLNDLVLKPFKAGAVMVPSAEGGAIIEAAFDDFTGGEDFNTYMDKNFNDVEWLGEGGIYRRFLGHAIAGSLLSYSHLRPGELTKTIKQQKKLVTQASYQIKFLHKEIEKNQNTEAGREKIVNDLKPKLEKAYEIYEVADNYISEAYALNEATDPQSSAKSAMKDFETAQKDHKKRTGKTLDAKFEVVMDGEGLNGDAASVVKGADGSFEIKVDARKYHKGIFGHELGHVYGELFGINSEAGLGKIVDYLAPIVNKNLAVDFKQFVAETYEGKQVKELNNEEQVMALIEMMGSNGSALVQNGAFFEAVNNTRGYFHRTMGKYYEGNAPQLKIESPQQLLNLLQRLASGAGKKGNIKQYKQLQGLYIDGAYVFDGATKEIKGTKKSAGIANQIANILLDQKRIASIPAAERTAEDVAKLKSNVARIKALKAQPSTTEAKKSDKEIEIFHGGEVSTVKDVKGNIYFSESKEQAAGYAKNNDGKVAKFKVKESEIASEAKVFEVIRELGIKPKIEDWSVDDSRLYELLDNRFDNAFSKEDLGKLNEALAEKGIKASRFTDSDMRTGKDTENIVVFDKSLLETNIDSKFNQIKALEKESKELAEKYGKDVIKSTKQTRLENELLEELKDPIGKLVTSRTKALFDPIAEDARAGVTREKFQDSMKSDLTAMILNEYKPGAQPIEKFIINRGYLRANNLAQRLGIKSAKDGIDKGMEAAEKVAAAEVTSNEKEAVTIEPVNKLIRDPELKAEFIKEIEEATKDLDPEEVNYKTLIDKAPELTKKVFGEVLKPNGKVDKAKTKQIQQQFIRNNASTIYKLLPEGARKFATGLKTATGIQPGLLKNFYEVGERAAMNVGTAAGLKTQVKKPFNEAAFLEVFGANKGQEPSRNHQTAIDALIKEVGKAMTNRTYRQALENADAPVSMNTIQKIADGKSINMASVNISKVGLLRLKMEEKDLHSYRQAVAQMMRYASSYFPQFNDVLNEARKDGTTYLQDVAEANIMADGMWSRFYNEAKIKYEGYGNLTSDPEFKKNSRVLLNLLPSLENAHKSIRIAITQAAGGESFLKMDGNYINRKSFGIENGTRQDLLEKSFSEKDKPVKFSETKSPKDYYQYAYINHVGKGKVSKAHPFGNGFNGQLEHKIIQLRKKYKENTDNSKFREELVDYMREQQTHPELRNTPGGYELTMAANNKILTDVYTGLAEAHKNGEISTKGLANLLRMQTNHTSGIFKAMVPFESVSMGNIKKFARGVGKQNTFNEHMVGLAGYNIDFMALVTGKNTNAKQLEAPIKELVSSLKQAVVDKPTQVVKDSRKYGGSAKRNFVDRVFNTFLRSNSLNNSLILGGEHKGLTQGEALYQEIGPDGIKKALDNVPAKKRGKRWNEINGKVTEILDTKKKASADIANKFNEIITSTTGLSKDISDVKAKQEAGSKGKYKLFVSASADDFVGLMNYNAGKGKEGDAHQAFFKEKLYDPYAEAYRQINADNVEMAQQFKDIKKHVNTNAPKFNLRAKVEGSNFTKEQALRATIWDSQGMEVPGISPAELSMLKKEVNSSVPLSVLKLNLKRIAKGEYHKPGKDWYASDIASDLRAGLSTTLRSKRLESWKENVDAMFTPETLNRLEAAHGTPYRKALEGMLDAMYTGRSRRSSSSSLEGRTLNYLNNSVGTIMFFNQRSATMQLTSAFNYINWHDNNPLKAGAAVANIPQYAKDIKTLFTSDWAKSRRQGLRINVTESEIADAVTGSENTPKSIVSLLLKKGFAPTQIADAVATAVGGASLYRNRIKRYTKEGMDPAEAEKRAMQDWVEISETNQQSSRPDKVSMQQRSDLGKLVLAFANTPMQYMRESKKAILDLKNGRGDKKTHLSKLAYYSVLQSAVFSAMQQAMFKMAWSDDEQDELWLKNKGPKVLNSMADGALRGMGYGGAIVSMIKNTGLELAKQNEYGYKGKLENASWKLLDISPPVASKVSKIRYSFKNIDRAGGFDKASEMPLSLENPFVKSAAGITEAVANVPTARILSKVTNLTELANAQTAWYEKMMIMAGWKKWEVESEKDLSKKKKTKKKRKKKGAGKRSASFGNRSYEPI